MCTSLSGGGKETSGGAWSPKKRETLHPPWWAHHPRKPQLGCKEWQIWLQRHVSECVTGLPTGGQQGALVWGQTFQTFAGQIKVVYIGYVPEQTCWNILNEFFPRFLSLQSCSMKCYRETLATASIRPSLLFLQKMRRRKRRTRRRLKSGTWRRKKMRKVKNHK